MKTINNILDDKDKLDDKKLEQQFNKWWPDFEEKFSSIKGKKESISYDKTPS